MRLVYHPHAKDELIEAAQYYGSRVPTLGTRLLNDVDRAVAAILESPTRWRGIGSGVRRYLLPHFPYAIYYRDYSDHLHLLAFKHHSRHPDYWRYRIAE